MRARVREPVQQRVQQCVRLGDLRATTKKPWPMRQLRQACHLGCKRVHLPGVLVRDKVGRQRR
eukprot:4566462-Pleurochrysis_carterae.AAC.1